MTSCEPILRIDIGPRCRVHVGRDVCDHTNLLPVHTHVLTRTSEYTVHAS